MREGIARISAVLDPPMFGRVAIVGASGTGKTSILREILGGRLDHRGRVIMFDPWGQLWGYAPSSLAEAVRILAGPYGRVRVYRPDLFVELVGLALEAGGALVVADEVQRLCPSRQTLESSAAILQLVNEGRHAGCPFIWATQRPGQVQAGLTANVDAQVVGRIGAATDLDVVSIWGLDRRQVVRLENHRFYLLAPGRELEVLTSRPIS